MESKKINQLATELAPVLSDLTIIGDPTTGISKKITLSQMASLFTGTVEEYPNLASFPLVGTADTIYIALDTNVLYRWNTSTNAYVELSPNIINSLVFNDANGFDGTIALVGSVATLTITTALTTGSVGFIGASGALLQDNANFFWDDTNNRLGIGTNAPTTAVDVFGSGIIGRLNGTSTNNAFLGFASAGTNKWSVGNVQSDHRFRIYNEATTSELVSVLQTGEFGIGIANPTTKIHIDGGASALIANLDANVSVAKSISFRSDNSNRINLEVSGTESGSNAGANFFIRRYSDAGALIDTPLTITRSTGTITLATALSGTSATLTGALTITNANLNLSNAYSLTARNNANSAYISLIQRNTSDKVLIDADGYGTILGGALSGISATFSSSVTATSVVVNNSGGVASYFSSSNASTTSGAILIGANAGGDFNLFNPNATPIRFFTSGSEQMRITSGGNVGIGTSSPAAYFGRTLTIDGATTQGLMFRDGGTDKAFIYQSSDFLNLGANVGGIIFKPADTERMRITSGGNVLIGTTTDGGQKLQVNGTLYASSVISSGTSISASTYVSAPSGFYTTSNNNSIPFTTWTTITTVDSNIMGMYLVVIGLTGGGLSDWAATGILYSNGTGASWIVGPTNGSLVQLRISGTNIQVFQNGGSPSQNLSYKLLKIA